MPNDIIMFNEGIASDVRSALQKPGYLKSAINIDFKKEGIQSLRPKFSAINTSTLNAIHSLKSFRDLILAGDSTYLRYSSGGNFTSLGSSFANAVFRAREYKDFLHIVNGTDNLFLDEDANLYHAFVDNPSSAPSGTSGVAGNPNDTYALYVSFLITWPNGQQYETGISDASDDVTVSSQKIEWSDIPTCEYEEVSGTAPTIHRKLYRGPGSSGSLSDIYYVDTIEDNVTTTYSDDFTDEELAANGACAVEEFDAPPVKPLFLEYHYSRLFLINTVNKHRLYYSEAPQGDTSTENEILRPLAFPIDNWIDLRAAGFGRVDPQGLLAWGTYIYIPLKHTWIRKDGNDPDTWNIKKTWAMHGIAAPETVTPIADILGVLGLSAPKGKTPGLSIFNGSTTRIITNNRFSEIFEDDLNFDSIENCKGAFDGRYYHFLYPSGGNEQPDKHAAFDLLKFPEIRLSYWEDLNSRCVDIDEQSSKVYFGGSDGYVRRNSGNESINIEVETHDNIGNEIALANTKKVLKEIKYSLNTGGEDVTLYIYLNGSLAEWSDGSNSKSISGTDDSIQVIKYIPKNWECYKYSIKIVGIGLETFELFSPWTVTLDPKG